MKKVVLLCFALAFLSLTASAVSAGDFARIYTINHLLQNSQNYDVVWEGPYKDGRLTVAFNGGNGNSDSILNSIELGDYQVLEYNKNNVFSYGDGGNYKSNLWGGRYNGGQSSVFYRDNSEQIRVVNEKPSVYYSSGNRFGYEEASIIYGNQYPRYDSGSKTYSWRY